ncbi:GNAT family N-acetyltransferase [Streptomyces sp. NPDC052012]|uniref:GNAT family N-acetyltransferase n=1 Tax=Streptomyces sp. NPDC052012 TaxID=3155051 RepID=UPI003451041D
MSDIEIRDDRAAGRLEAVVAGGEVVGHIQYFTLDAPERALVPVHTVVEPAHEGQGIAGSLAREFYAIAAREDSAVAPLCPYVTKWAARHPDEAPAATPELMRAAKDWLTAHPEGF